MKRIILALMAASPLFFAASSGQISDNIPVHSVTAPDMNHIALEDKDRGKNGELYRIGVSLPADIDLKKDGEWRVDQDGNLIYSIRIFSQGAKALNLGYDAFTLPVGAELRIYNTEENFVAGPYTDEHNSEDGIMTTMMVKGDNCVLEVVVPKGAVGALDIHINHVGYFYRDVDPFANQTSTRDFGDSDNCEVNINCSEGNSWQDEEGGVARILVKEGSNYGWCSGSLINNTLDDCTPYFLTAQHCGAGASATDFRSWTFYFEFEAAGCSNPGSAPSYTAVTGSVRVSASGSSSTINRSDFLLLILKTRPAAGASAHYNGWDRTGSVSGGGVSIHHPAGDIKKISTYSNTPISSTWTGTPNTHWRVNWISTTNGHGVTEGGSSGSPLFDGNGRIIGDLSGGSSYCVTPTSPDLYGKFSYSWSSCGGTPELRLSPWLDRTTTGATTMDGRDNDCATQVPPSVDFYASNNWPAISETVTLYDISTGSPFYWQWVISPATYSFTGGTNQYSQNPQVNFSAYGYYTVQLYAANIGGYNFRNKSLYIHVGDVGIEEEEIATTLVYPNPATNEVFISYENVEWDFTKTTITMLDMSGKIILMERMSSSTGNTFHIGIPEDVANGLYVVKITDGDKSSVNKITIQR